MAADPRLDDLMDRWETAVERGKSVDPAQLCTSCPELLPALREKIAALQQMDSFLARPEADGWTFASDGSLSGTAPLVQIPVPKNVGRYRIDELIGEGGFGRVWRAFDPLLDREVAVKVLRGRRTRWRRQVEQFQAEAQKLAKLRHPNIVPVYDVGQDGPQVYLVSGLIVGENLAVRQSRQPLSVSAAVELIAKVSDALYHAHQSGIVHRDIKPANILIDKQGEPFVTDFGIAISTDEALQGTQIAAGTPRYMAPGQHSNATADAE